jgi:hypothetical protein
MIRRALSASLSGTAIRISPSEFTDIGRIACGLPDTRKLSIPWLSSSDRMMLASMSDRVVKITTGAMGACNY